MTKKNQNSKYIRAFNYAGAKIKFIDTFLELEKQINTKESIYVEPFIGSGAIYCNTSNYSCYIINDISKYITLIWDGLKNLEYEDFLSAKEYVLNNFGNVKKYKKSYYELRDYTNKQLIENFDIKNSPFVIFLINTCINSMFRASKNGINQGFGGSLKRNKFMLDQQSFNHIHEKLKMTKILKKDYKELLVDSKEYFYFIDPPYVDTMSPGYINYFTIEDHKQLVNILYNMKNAKYIYTDTLTDYNKILNHEFFMKKNSICPSKNNEQKSNYNEYYFTNLKIPQIENWF